MAHALPSEILSTCSDGLLFCFAQWSSEVTLGGFWIFALLSFSVVMFIATARFGSLRAFGYSSWIGMIGGIWLAILTLIPWWVASAFIIIGVIGTASMVLSDK